jgi:hypothetical protein
MRPSGGRYSIPSSKIFGWQLEMVWRKGGFIRIIFFGRINRIIAD